MIQEENSHQKSIFKFLISVKMSHVFLHGYYMPPIFAIYDTYKELLGKNATIRLLGFDRKAMEERTGKKWGRRIAPQEEDLDLLAVMLGDLQSRQSRVLLYVNNHFEGSAPGTITRLREKLSLKD